MKNIINWCSDRCYQKPGSFNLTKTFYLNFNQSSILQQNNLGIIFPREDKDPILRLTTVSFKSYTCYFKGSYNSKTVCCCGNTVRRKGINSKYLTFWKKYLYNLICFLFFPLQKWIFSAPKNCHLDVDFLTFTYLAGFHQLKVNNRNSWTRREICSKLTIKTQEWRQICSKLTMKTPERCHFPSFGLNMERNLNIFGVVLVSLLQDTYFVKERDQFKVF